MNTQPDYTTAKFTLDTDRERFANWLQDDATRRFEFRPIENQDGSHIRLQPMSKRQVKQVIICSFEGIYEPTGENRAAKLMGVLFNFKLMPEKHSNKFEVKTIIRQYPALPFWSELIVSIARTYPESEKTIKQQFDIEPPNATPTLDNPQINQMTMVDNWDKVLASDIVPDEVVNLWKEIKEDNSLFVEMVMLSNQGYTQSAIAARQKIQVQSVKNNLTKMRDKYNKDGKEIVLLAVTRRKLGIKPIKEDTGAI